MQVWKNMCSTFASNIWKYDENTIVIGFFMLTNG
jgi:hypothetical protein